jgi:hypothetical protein
VAKSVKSLGRYTKIENKPKVQLPTRVAPKEDNHPMLETKKWLYGTKKIHVCAMDGILEGGFVVSSQIVFVLEMHC